MDGVTGVLVLRIGDGTSAYAPTVGLNRISPAFVDEYRVGDLDAPYLAQTITLPFTPELVAQRGVPGSRLCGVSGRGDSGIESILQLSVDGSAVSLGCFDAPAGTNSSVYALPGVDKVVALLRQDGTVDTRTAFAAYAGGSFIATLYDSAASGRFYVAGYNTSGIGIRTFVSGAATAGAGAPATPTVTNSDSVWIGVTFKALGTDASRSGLLAAANSGTASLGYITRFTPAWPAGAPSSTAAVLPFVSGGSVGGFWFAGPAEVWLADMALGLVCFRLQAVGNATAAWARVGAWRTPAGHALRTISGRARSAAPGDVTLFVSSFNPTVFDPSFVYAVVAAELLAGGSAASTWKTIASSPPFTLLRSVSVTPFNAALEQMTPTGTPSASPTASATPSASPTPSNTPSASVTPSGTGTAVSPTQTPSNSATPTSTLSGSRTPSATPTNTASPSNTPSGTRTGTPSASATASASQTPSATPTGSLSAGASPSATLPPSTSPTATPTASRGPQAMDGLTGILVARIGDGSAAFAPTTGGLASPVFIEEWGVVEKIQTSNRAKTRKCAGIC
jgi:hypothetical protein